MGDEEIEVGTPHLIVHDGQPVGIVAVTPGPTEDRLREHLGQAGYRLEEPQAETFTLGGECEVARPRTCELEIVLGRLEELAEECGVSSDEIDTLADRPFTEAEAEAAARTVMARMPDGEQRTEAKTFVAVAFEGAGRDA